MVFENILSQVVECKVQVIQMSESLVKQVEEFTSKQITQLVNLERVVKESILNCQENDFIENLEVKQKPISFPGKLNQRDSYYLFEAILEYVSYTQQDSNYLSKELYDLPIDDRFVKFHNQNFPHLQSALGSYDYLKQLFQNSDFKEYLKYLHSQLSLVYGLDSEPLDQLLLKYAKALRLSVHLHTGNNLRVFDFVENQVVVEVTQDQEKFHIGSLNTPTESDQLLPEDKVILHTGEAMERTQFYSKEIDLLQKYFLSKRETNKKCTLQ